MPIKRRTPKHRINPEAELAAWSEAFESGLDFFGDLADFGLQCDAAVRAAMPCAWKRLGAAFMARWVPNAARALPWAF